MLRTDGGNLDVEQALAVCLHRAERGGGGLQRSCKTEGEVVGFAAQAFGAALGVALVVGEFGGEALEGAPECDEVCAGVGPGEVWLEAVDARSHAGDLAGSQVDQEIDLAVRVEEGGGDGLAVGGVEGEVVDGVFVREHAEAELDDVREVRLQRLNRAEAPEDLQDDLPERFHGWEYNPGPRGCGIWGALSPKLSR